MEKEPFTAFSPPFLFKNLLFSVIDGNRLSVIIEIKAFLCQMVTVREKSAESGWSEIRGSGYNKM